MMPSLFAIVAYAPVMDIDGTFFVQGGIFLALVFLLQPLLFKPWLATQLKRSEAISGALEAAETMQREAESLGKDHEDRLSGARDLAQKERASVRRDSEQKRATKLAEIRESSNAEFEKHRAEIEAEAAAARATLNAKVDELAEDIVTKVLGRNA
jgi:F-type H+-transporting ATPase subunit b